MVATFDMPCCVVRQQLPDIGYTYIHRQHDSNALLSLSQMHSSCADAQTLNNVKCVYRSPGTRKRITLTCKTNAINIFRLNWELISSHRQYVTMNDILGENVCALCVHAFCTIATRKRQQYNYLKSITKSNVNSQHLQMLCNKSQCVAHTLFCCRPCRHECRDYRTSWLHQIMHSSTSTTIKLKKKHFNGFKFSTWVFRQRFLFVLMAFL